MRHNLEARRSPFPSRTGRIKVCHIVVGSVLAGAQRVVLDICESLDPARYECHAMFHSEGPLADACREIEVACHLLPTLRREIRPHWDWRGVFHVRRICREHRFDIVHTHSAKGGFLGRIGARWAGVPHVLHHIQGYPFHEYSGVLARLAFVQLERFAAKFCDRMIYVNNEERTTAITKGWIPESKGLTIYNGTDLDAFNPQNNVALREEFRRENGLKDDDVAIVIPARVDPQKQPMILPEIAAALESLQAKRNWRFFIAGSGYLEPSLREKVNSLRMGHRIDFLGWYKNARKLFAAADIVLLPSLWEGLPVALIEAQAAALPIVASDVKGNREVVTEETGFLCEPTDPRPYADALKQLCDDSFCRRRLGIAARYRADRHFNSRQTMGRFVELYDALTNPYEERQSLVA